MDFRSFSERQADLTYAGNEYGLWVLKAQELLAASSFLIVHCPFRNYLGKDDVKFQKSRGSIEEKASTIAPMLWAMAAECLLKALWLKLGNKLIENGKFNKIPNTNDHHLDSIAIALSNECGISFSDEEIGILFKLSSNITSGRYPVPRNAHTRKPKNTSGITLEIDEGSWRYPNDDELVEALFERLWALITST